jgi:hypothetical protein
MKKETPQMRPKNRGLWFPLANASSAKREFSFRMFCQEIISLMGKSKPESSLLIKS